GKPLPAPPPSPSFPRRFSARLPLDTPAFSCTIDLVQENTGGGDADPPERGGRGADLPADRQPGQAPGGGGPGSAPKRSAPGPVGKPPVWLRPSRCARWRRGLVATAVTAKLKTRTAQAQANVVESPGGWAVAVDTKTGQPAWFP